ncbi:hypothetical protein [Streptomyces sp. NPDC094049]|uniref:hypothetical protein n=1 Tax=Streptomyces sp. NPDC094049 TaxID=3154987 RepID=UPI003328C821
MAVRVHELAPAYEWRPADANAMLSAIDRLVDSLSGTSAVLAPAPVPSSTRATRWAIGLDPGARSGHADDRPELLVSVACTVCDEAEATGWSPTAASDAFHAVDALVQALAIGGRHPLHPAVDAALATAPSATATARQAFAAPSD